MRLTGLPQDFVGHLFCERIGSAVVGDASLAVGLRLHLIGDDATLEDVGMLQIVFVIGLSVEGHCPDVSVVTTIVARMDDERLACGQMKGYLVEIGCAEHVLSAARAYGIEPPKDYSPEEILQLPERMATKMGKHIVVCIDEFQQIGEFPDSLKVQKKMRGIWQLQNNASYCLFGSKKHLLTNLFQSKRMPFYQFGDIMFLQPIPTEDWIPFIRQKFEEKKMSISDALIEKICSTVQNQSSYVQQLAWNVMLNTTKKADEATLETAIEDLLNQNSLLFLQQIENLTAYQMNFLKAVAKGVHTDFTSKEVLSTYDLGSKSNVSRIKTVLTQKELIEKTPNGIVLTDPVFELWFTKEWCE